MPSTRNITVRLPENIYNESIAIAQSRKISFNTLMQEGLAKVIREQKEQDLYDAFSLIGQDDDSTVEYAVQAQSEVVLSDEQ